MTAEPAIESAAHGLTQNAPVLFHLFGCIPISNSMLVSWGVTLVIILMVRAAAGKVAIVPGGMQNFFEFVIETLYETLEGIMGSHLTRRTFWFFATIFLFILSANWLSLVPLIGNLTVASADGHPVGLFRAVNSDLNMPLALATLYGVLWLYWSLRETGPLGMIQHIFGVKGGLTGALKWGLLPIFFAVGLIEIISILFRQISLPLRLYGNIFAGENLLETMTHVGLGFPGLAIVLGFILPLPFYFLEILVAFVQALVFMLLTAVFTSMMCQHEEEAHE
ncbi:MAG: F0F1 ATP synthase subunit A [Verrucomicrobia bacterium]|nr:F0F1 ATP synthase subunit A [Verrucomicrobiota bacterium]